MKKLAYLLIIILSAYFFTGCSESKGQSKTGKVGRLIPYVKSINFTVYTVNYEGKTILLVDGHNGVAMLQVK